MKKNPNQPQRDIERIPIIAPSSIGPIITSMAFLSSLTLRWSDSTVATIFTNRSIDFYPTLHTLYATSHPPIIV
jgi:hypothetical protein